MSAPEIVIGPPGTGKTTTLLGMVEEELEAGTAPEHIGFVSFTRKAAHEARDRAVKRFGMERDRLSWFSTIHSLCFRALSLQNADILAGEALQDFAEWIGIRVTPKHKRSHVEMEEGRLVGNETGDRILQMENRARIEDRPLRDVYDEFDDGLSWWEVERVARGLEEFKSSRHLMDFSDILVVFAQHSWRPPLEVLLVDEAQDLSMLQWRVVEKLSAGIRRYVVAGDDDQAIYRWAGAAVDHFVDMEGSVRVLGQSYRVPRRIQRLADAQLRGIAHRRPKDWAPRDEDGTLQQLYMRDVDFSGQDILVLGRNNVHLQGVKNALHGAGMLYEIGGHPSVSEKRRRQIVNWEALRRGQQVMVEDVLRIYEEMASGEQGVTRGYKTQMPGFAKDEMVTMADLRARGGLNRDDVWHQALVKIPPSERQYIQACLRSGERLSQSPRIRLSTIHSAKGGEAAEVVLIPDMATRTWAEQLANPADEARVWYVAATRARETLTIVRPTTDRHFTFRR